MKRERKQKGQTIQGQILKGYFLLTGIIGLLVAISILCLALTRQGYGRASAYEQQRYAAQEVITAHYQWLEQLSDSITTGSEFKGSLDPETCALGKWIDLAEKQISDDEQMSAALSGIIDPHREIHLEAASLITLSRTNQDGAYRQYSSDFKPKVEIIGSGLKSISLRFQQRAEEITAGTRRTAAVSNLLLIAAGILAVMASLAIGRRLSRRIAAPILAVAHWSEEFSTGVDNLRLEEEETGGKNAAEIDRMICSFKTMAETIRENVRIIQRVAEGDLTAYVEIRSDGDSLGRNLYHLVQNNDHTFANLLRVADSVATNAGHIASASQALAESSTTQAGAVEVLSNTVDKANALATMNAERSQQAASSIEGMAQTVQNGKERMDTLVGAVEEIRAASEKIALVMKSINDVAFQTNILALNAAVEAARAGAAGKGFAVVADEVRNLAAKSAEAADQSRLLIEDTIQKALQGSQMASETSENFVGIVTQTAAITDEIEKITGASRDQQKYIHEIHEEITRISDVVSSNAASSEETAATTHQMDSDAEFIRGEMRRFNLRKREPGKPYIPPEKANDAEFIRQANDNFIKANGQTAVTH